MLMEQKFKQQLGEMLFTILALQYQLETANSKIKELESNNVTTQL